MHLLTKEHRPLLYLITFVALFRLLVAPHLPLGVDEAHYLLYAINLDWSYFDHPPLVGWTHYIFTSLFGLDEFGARVSATLIGLLVSIFLYQFLYLIDRNARLAFVGVVALHGVFIFNALFLMLMPDTLLFLLILPLIFTLRALEKTQGTKEYLLLGLLLGLAGLSKYTAILFIPPALLYFLIKKRYDIFLSWKILFTFFFAFILVLPVFLWNIQNNWISFSYQSEHVIASQAINLRGFGASLSAQFFAYNPFLSFVAFYGLFRALKSKNDTLFLSGLFGAILYAFFTYASLYKTALPHWSALFYLLFIPLGVYFLYERSLAWRRYLKFAIGFGLVLSSLIYTQIATKIIPLPDRESLHVDIYGFSHINARANAHIKDKEAIAVTHWTLAARALIYNRAYDSELYLLDERYDQFDIWQKNSPLGANLIVIDLPYASRDLEAYLKCDTLTLLEAFDLPQNPKGEKKIKLFRCTNYQGLR